MKIIFVCAAGIVSGKERQTFNSIVELKKRGNNVSCIMSSWGTIEFERMLSEASIPYVRLRIGFISKTLTVSAIRMTLHQFVYLPSMWFKYRRFVMKSKPDYVIHTNFHHVFLLLPFMWKEKNVFYAHDPFRPSRFFKSLFRLFNKRIELFIAVSEFIRTGLLALGLPVGKVVCVYNGFEPVQIPNVHEGSDSSKLRIGIVGQIGIWKGHNVLVQSFAEIVNRIDKVELHIIGDGLPDYMDQLKKEIDSLGITRQVVFRGSLIGLPAIYDQLDIVCVPSIFEEPFGLTAVEAGYFRIPVVSSDAGGLPEVIEDTVTGIVVPRGNSDSLRDALLNLLENKSLRNRMGEAAHERVMKMFTINESTTVLLNHFTCK